MSYGRRNIIQFAEDDFGVYISGSRGPLGTPLVARGPWDFVTNLNVEIHMRDVLVQTYDRARSEYVPLPPSKRGLGVPEDGYDYPQIIDGKDLNLR